MVVSIDGLLALLAAILKQTCHFIISCIVYLMLFEENKFFFFCLPLCNMPLASS